MSSYMGPSTIFLRMRVLSENSLFDLKCTRVYFFHNTTPAGQQTPKHTAGDFLPTDSPTSPRAAPLSTRPVLLPHERRYAAAASSSPRLIIALLSRRVPRSSACMTRTGARGGITGPGCAGGGGWGGQQTHTPTPRARGHRTRGVGGWGARPNAEVGARGGGDFGGVLAGTSHPGTGRVRRARPNMAAAFGIRCRPRSRFHHTARGGGGGYQPTER